MSGLKKHLTSTGDTYAYVYHPAASGSPQKPTLLFCHGFPDSHEMWLEQIAYFTKLGYGAIALDMLGYGETDKPTDEAKYSTKRMAESVMSVLDKEGVDQVVAIGHDWGSMAVGRLYLFYPHRVLGCVHTNIPFNAPTEFNLDKANAMTAQLLGYSTYGYWDVMVNHDEMLMEKFESFKCVMFPADPMVWKDNLCAIGGLKTWLEQDKRGEKAEWFKGEHEAAFTKRMMRDRFAAPTNWYNSIVHNVSWKDEKELSPDLVPIDKPVLMIGATKDCVIPGPFAAKIMQSSAKDLTVETVEGGHWTLFENGRQWTAFTEKWLKEKFPG